VLVTRQKVFRRFGYATVPVSALAAGPAPFTLLGQNIALFLDADGKPGCLEDRCCHRTARLSKGWIRGGNIVCGYHGWEYDRTGKLMNIPQFPFEQPVPVAKARDFRAQERYGYVWVALEERSHRFGISPRTMRRATAASISSTSAGTAPGFG